jgi:hypothetical protein
MMGLPTSLLLQSIFARFSILPGIEFREKSEKKSLCFGGVPKLRKGNAKLLKFKTAVRKAPTFWDPVSYFSKRLGSRRQWSP